LWDEQVKITGLESFHVEFKYRFVQGKPQPDRDYRFELEMGMLYTLKKLRGTDLKPEGQFQLDLPLFREGKAYTMRVMQSGPNAVFTYQPVSNELKGTLQPRLVK
jgi:hypothetical protein